MFPSDSRFVRNPILTATAFGLGSALLATAAFSFPPGGPPIRAILSFAVALGLAVGIITYVGVSALS
ncbi:hypothetical protein ACOZ4N_01845 [Halorientalis pallida]|uniref:hypothetical protein n=1 Tax=Halorientalis pallida TaxID=2479928 RepID=UPI003C6EE605